MTVESSLLATPPRNKEIEPVVAVPRFFSMPEVSNAGPLTPSDAVSARSSLEEVRKRAVLLMQSLGEQELGASLHSRGWSFEFDRARRRLGSCRWSTRGRPAKKITLSGHYAARLGLSFRDARGLPVIEDVIRHEIAHAIDFERRGRSDHGRTWKAICKRVGADPTRLYETQNAEAFLIPGKYVARCPACEQEIAYFRRPSRPRACKRCCDLHAQGRYDERFRLRVVKLY